MKAAQLHTFGAPPRLQEVPEPQAGAGEVIVHVRCAAIHPIVKALASGKHYASPKTLPVGCGLDGVGTLDDGTRVYFGPVRAPHGSLAQRVAVPRAACIAVPKGVSDVTAAALVNPGIAAWLPLSWRAKMLPGESVCILGATGTAGKLAIRAAKLQGAGRVVGVGRNPAMLERIKELGADTVIALGDNEEALIEAFAREAGPKGFDVIIDYLWGKPTEALLKVIAKAKFATEMRLVEVGESAGPSIVLPGGILRSTGLSICGFGLRSYGIAPPEVLAPAFDKLMHHAAQGEITIDTTEAPLADLETAWTSASSEGRSVVRVAG